MTTQEYIESSLQQFQYYKHLGEAAMEQLTDEQLIWEPTIGVNSISVVVGHLRGNMLSRWTEIFSTDGEKEWRNRDSEFVETLTNRVQILQAWQQGWQCLFDALASITPADYDRLLFIRNQGHTIVEAVNRQLCHYSYHVGQIVFIAKMLKGDDWKSLSIPRGNSEQYNKEKFEHEKRAGSFLSGESRP